MVFDITGRRWVEGVPKDRRCQETGENCILRSGKILVFAKHSSLKVTSVCLVEHVCGRDELGYVKGSGGKPVGQR